MPDKKSPDISQIPIAQESISKYLIELIYALPQEQKLITTEIEEGCNVGQAIELSGILQQYPEIDLAVNQVGIFSKVCKLTERLREGDRIEIYRALLADPKEIRKARALKQK